MRREQRMIGAGALLILFFCSPGNSAAEAPFEPKYAISAAVFQLEQTHLSQRKVDEELAELWIRTFLDRLDPSHRYFLDSDIHEFQRSESASIERIRRGDFAFPKQIRTRYRTRVRESLAIAASELETLKNDPPASVKLSEFDSFAQNQPELSQRWHSSLFSELIIEMRHGRERSEVLDQIRQRHRRIQNQADTMNDERLCQIWIDSLAKSYDPHSVYLSPSQVEWYNQAFIMTTFSLGVRIRQQGSRYQFGWPYPMRRSHQIDPQYAGWTLLSVNRLSGEVIDVMEMHPEDLQTQLCTGLGALEEDTEVILELMNPITHERVTTSWPRFSYSE